jgi:hypothetical protein
MAFRSGSKCALLFCQQFLTAAFFVASASLPQPEHGESALMLIQTSIRAHEMHLTTKPNPEPPRMYVAEGCDGSTAGIQHAIRILALHGIDGGDPEVNREMLIGKPNIVGEKIKGWHKMYRDHNQTLVFKSILHRDLEVTRSHAIKQLGTMAVYVTRRNHLDQVVCMIRDCFVDTGKQTSVFGYPVKSNGKSSNMCFKRRSTSGQIYKAKLRVVEDVPSGMHNRSFLAESLEKAKQRVIDGSGQLKKAGYLGAHNRQIATEDLQAFQAGGADNLKISLQAWTTLLKA